MRWYNSAWRTNVSRYSIEMHHTLLFTQIAPGALVLFYPYTFSKGDLSRYQYAKLKWISHEGLSAQLWPVKAQVDTLTQCFANSLFLACPILLASMNSLTSFHILEICGAIVWTVAWIFENMADMQKVTFLKECKAQAAKPGADKDALKTAVLGYTPYDGRKYWLWTACRHPNYFFEWMSWWGFGLIGLGNVLTKDDWLEGGQGLYMTVVLSMCLFIMIRTFYDCLVYWTGAAPAEHQSVRKRKHYREYQRTTRVFFPFPTPHGIFNHHMTAGWPIEEKGDAGSSNYDDKRHLNVKCD